MLDDATVLTEFFSVRLASDRGLKAKMTRAFPGQFTTLSVATPSIAIGQHNWAPLRVVDAETAVPHRDLMKPGTRPLSYLHVHL